MPLPTGMRTLKGKGVKFRSNSMCSNYTSDAVVDRTFLWNIFTDGIARRGTAVSENEVDADFILVTNLISKSPRWGVVRNPGE